MTSMASISEAKDPTSELFTMSPAVLTAFAAAAIRDPDTSSSPLGRFAIALVKASIEAS